MSKYETDERRDMNFAIRLVNSVFEEKVMQFHKQTVYLVQSGGGDLGEIRFRYGSWRFIPRHGAEITGEQIALIGKKQLELDENDRA